MNTFYDRAAMMPVALSPLGTTGKWTDSMGNVYEVDRDTKTCEKKS